MEELVSQVVGLLTPAASPLGDVVTVLKLTYYAVSIAYWSTRYVRENW